MQAVGRSWQGIRSRNEDVYTIREDLNMAAVADGMGGAPGGNIASRLAVDEFADSLERFNPDGHYQDKDLVNAALCANTVVHERPNVQPELTGMGSTIVAAVFNEAALSLCHVGDSRAYLYRQKELLQVTRDHSVVQDMMDKGQITEQEAEHVVFKSTLSQALGPAQEVTPEVNHLEMKEKDVLLLCSDGLCGFVPDEEIADVLNAHGRNLRTCMNILVETAVKFGSTDNITVVLATV